MPPPQSLALATSTPASGGLATGPGAGGGGPLSGGPGAELLGCGAGGRPLLALYATYSHLVPQASVWLCAAACV